jgi:hypothetical protein
MKLTRTNEWIWREGEIAFKQFTQLERSEKDAHINLLLQLGEDNLSTNDLYILSIYAAHKLPQKENKKFLEL